MGPHRDTNTEQTGWPVVRGKVFACGAIWQQKLVELRIGNQCQKRLSAGCQVRWLLFNSFILGNFCQKIRLLYIMLQSWTKSVKNFALSYPQKAYPADRVPLRLLPHPTLVNVVHSGGSNSLWGKDQGRVYFNSSCFRELYLETKNKNIFCNILCPRLYLIRTKTTYSSVTLAFGPDAKLHLSKFRHI